MKHADGSRIAYDEYTPEGFDELLDSAGYVHMDGVPEGFDHLAFLRRFGRLLPQYDGEFVWSIKAEEGYDDVYHSLNTKELLPHTEGYEFEGLPPRYLALWCVTPASDDGGSTMLSDTHAFLDTLPAADRAELASRSYEFVSTPGLRDMSLGRVARHPVLQLRVGLPSVTRFSCSCIVSDGDEFVAGVQKRLVDFAEKERVAVKLQSRSLLLWDNFRMTHSRDSFADRRRHLRRVWLGEN